MKTVFFQDLGNVVYDTAWNFQETLLKDNLQIKANHYHITEDQYHNRGADTTDYLIFCEHPHVYTLGKSGKLAHLLISEEKLRQLNATFFQTNRGGDITYHGPGQIVGYPILDLEHFSTDLGKYMRNLEEVIIRTMNHFDIFCGRLPGSTGVWLDPDNIMKARKICAMGVRCSRWITMHGFALNVNTDLSYFNHIVPCGITDKKVTSMQAEKGYKMNIEDVKTVLAKEFENVFDIKLINNNSAVVEL